MTLSLVEADVTALATLEVLGALKSSLMLALKPLEAWEGAVAGWERVSLVDPYRLSESDWVYLIL